jgi:hypothetical protein
VIACGRLNKCRTNRSSSSRREVWVAVVTKSVTLRERRMRRYNEGSGSSAVDVGKIDASLFGYPSQQS